MEQSRITVSACLRISLVLVLTLIGAKAIFAQQSRDLSFLQSLDPELEIPEEDLFLIDEFLKGHWSYDMRAAKQLMKLSFISADDEKALKKVSDASSLSAITENPDVSDHLKYLIQTIPAVPKVVRVTGDILLKQSVVFSDDYRYRMQGHYRTEDFTAGALIERDPYENSLLDHSSGFITKQYNFGELLAGDYQIVTGYGLWSWRSVSTRKSFETIAGLPRMGRGIAPYRSSNEYWYIRGLAFSGESKYGEWLLSAGYTHQDGGIDSSGVVSISTSGLHTGESTIARANNLTEGIVLGQWRYSGDATNITASAAGTQWRDPTSIDKGDWSGSIAFNQSFQSGILFGEFARGYDQTGGAILGTRLKFSNFQYLLSSRYYSKGYSALRSNPYAEWLGKDRNEVGLFQSVFIKQKRHRFTFYGDLFKTASAETGDIFAESGQEAGIRYEWKRGRRYQRVQWKWENESIESYEIFLPEVQSGYKADQTFRYSGVFELRKPFWAKLQATYSQVEVDNQKFDAYGFESLFWWNGDNLTIALDFVTTFISEGNARIYFWDVNLPGEMTTRMYSTSGFSPALKILYRSGQGFELGARTRVLWKEFYFKGTPLIYGALSLEIML